MNKVFAALICVSLMGCKAPESTPEPSLGYEFYPLVVSNYNVYRVNGRIMHATLDSLYAYEVMELVAESYEEGNENVYVLEKYIRPLSSVNWPDMPDTVQAVRMVNNQLILTENNKPLVKLVFPAREGRRWNGNALTTEAEDYYTMKDLNQTYQIGNQSYSPTVVVEQSSDTTNRIRRDKRFEVYAGNIGLLYQYSEMLSLDFSSGDTLNAAIYTKEYLYGSR